MSKIIRPQTVTLIGKLLHPLTESNLIPVPEYREVIAQLKYLANRGTPLPTVIPKLVDQTEAATMLGISLANFKRLEREGYFPFKRKMVGTSVRYRNTDLVHFIMNEPEGNGSNGNLTAVY